jgi:hypothetical protein
MLSYADESDEADSEDADEDGDEEEEEDNPRPDGAGSGLDTPSEDELSTAGPLQDLLQQAHVDIENGVLTAWITGTMQHLISLVTTAILGYTHPPTKINRSHLASSNKFSNTLQVCSSDN